MGEPHQDVLARAKNPTAARVVGFLETATSHRPTAPVATGSARLQCRALAQKKSDSGSHHGTHEVPLAPRGEAILEDLAHGL